MEKTTRTPVSSFRSRTGNQEIQKIHHAMATFKHDLEVFHLVWKELSAALLKLEKEAETFMMIPPSDLKPFWRNNDITFSFVEL